MASTWTDAQIAAAQERKYVRDWHGRFSRVASTRAKVQKVRRVRKVHLFKRGHLALHDAQMAGKRVEPPTWDKIKGDNARRDGLKLYKMKKAGKFPSNVEFYKEADRLHREFRKAHPNGNFASKNQIANAAYRYEWDETGTVHYLEWPDAPKKAAPAKKAVPAKKAPKPHVVDKTKGGMAMTTKVAPAKKAAPNAKGIPNGAEPGWRPEPKLPEGFTERDLAKFKPHEIRRLLRKKSQEVSDLMDQQVGGKITPELRAKARKTMDEMMFLDKYADKMKPDWSRDLDSAIDLTDLENIMVDRHPSLGVGNFELVVAKKRTERETYWADRGVGHYNMDRVVSPPRITLEAAKETFKGLDMMMIKYPDVDIYRFDCHIHEGHDKIRTGASCSRGTLIGINMNPYQLLNVQEALRRQRNSSDSGWHARNHEKNPFRNNIIHEFGHAIDWRANIVFKDLDMSQIDARSAKRRKDISKILVDEYHKQNGRLPKDQRAVLDWLYASKQITGYSFDVNDKTGETIIPRILDDDELLAEAFTDVEINGSKATGVNKALHAYVVANLKKNRNKGK